MADVTHKKTATYADEPGAEINKAEWNDLHNVSNIVDADIASNAAIDATKVANGSVSNTEFQYLDGLGANIQTQINALAAAGYVVGPASATDNAIARFDLTTGKVIQNSNATIADTTGDITAGKFNGNTIGAGSTSGTNTGDQVVPVNTSTTASNFFTAYNSTTGAFTKAQPTFTDISGTAAAGQLPLATTSTFGAVKPDGTTITISAGVISAVGGGSGTVTSVASADGSITVTNPTTTADLAVVKAPKLTTARTINGTSFDGTANITVTAAAGTLTGTTLNSSVVTSSLTALGSQSQDLNMNSHKVTNVTDPTSAQDAATKAYVDNAVVGLLDYRGSYDASTNLFPATGGSGLLGAVLKGDFWICSVAGTLGGTATTPGDLIIALVDTPGQTAGNWDIIDHDISTAVTSVSGTTNRITSTGGQTPVIDISSTFEALLGKVASPLSQFASTTSAQLRTVLSDETGTGAAYFQGGDIGTPSAGVGTNLTGTAAGLTAGGNLAFKTYSVAGQSDVVADSTADTLTLVAGTNMTITTNAATDTITFTASGGGGGTTYYEVQWSDALFLNGINVFPSFWSSNIFDTATYNNGASGVGATLTALVNGALTDFFGYSTVALNDKFIITNVSSTSGNGIYTITNLGSAGTKWVLTRDVNYDTVAELTKGKTFVIDNIINNSFVEYLYLLNTPVDFVTDLANFAYFSNPSDYVSFSQDRNGLVPGPSSSDISANFVLQANGSWVANGGSTAVLAASTFGTDNRMLRSDGTGRGSQSTGITVDDSNNVSGVGTLASGAITSTGASTFGTVNQVGTPVNLTTQGAAIAATTLYAVPSAQGGFYRIDWEANVTRAATTSSTLGGALGLQIRYTQNAVVKTQTRAGNTSLTSGTNTTAGGAVGGSYTIYCDASTNIQYLMDYTSSGATTMQYSLNIVVTKIK